MPKTIKNIIILSTLNLVFFSLCLYFLIDIKKIDKTVSSRLTQIESEIRLDEALRSIKIMMNETKKEREQITLILVQPDSTVDFIESVESFGRVAGVKLEIESVGVDNVKDKKASTTESLSLSLKTEGSWSNIIHLLSLLENMPHKISFDNVRLGKVSEESSSNTSYWDGNFSFSVLKMKNFSETENKVN